MGLANRATGEARQGPLRAGSIDVTGSLNVAGATFRLSGYRAMDGRVLMPTEKPIELANGALTFPGTFPASLITARPTASCGPGHTHRHQEIWMTTLPVARPDSL